MSKFKIGDYVKVAGTKSSQVGVVLGLRGPTAAGRLVRPADAPDLDLREQVCVRVRGADNFTTADVWLLASQLEKCEPPLEVVGYVGPPREWGERERLPADREGATHHFAIYTGLPEPEDWRDCYAQVGLYPDGRVGELFVKVGKSGEALAALDQWAMAVSFALQYGADARELLGKFVGQRFEPAGRTRGCEEIRQCSSVVDYVARWVLLRFYPEPASVEGTP